MASNEYDALLEELKSLLEKKGELSLDDLKEWASQRQVGSLVLTLLVNDLLESKVAKPLGEKVTLDVDLGLQIPSIIVLAEREQKVEEHKKEGSLLPLISATKPLTRRTHKSPRKLHKKRKAASLSITSFFGEIEETKESETLEHRKESVQAREEPKEPTERREPLSESLPRSIETGTASLEGLDEDLIKAIEYLSSYWSVGEIRFALDLKRMGIEDPERVIRRLLELGYIERTKLGVINATNKLPRIETRKYLSDLF